MELTALDKIERGLLVCIILLMMFLTLGGTLLLTVTLLVALVGMDTESAGMIGATLSFLVLGIWMYELRKW